VKGGAEAIRRWGEAHPGERLDLIGADLRNAQLGGTNLSNADLRGARLLAAQLPGASLSRAQLSGGNLRLVNLSDADLRGANLGECKCGSTVFGAVDLSETIGLEKVSHYGPSTVGVDTLFSSKGKVPEVFLRGAGVPEILITYLGSLTGKALEFYTCFISFTEADDAFSQRLHNDLQAAGVRCWRWKEDARWGRALMGEVDTAIRMYDKLVVILSGASLKAEPVIREIERALQKEQREAKEVLFPIRVDDAVFSWKHALQADVVRKAIGDFRGWQDPGKYDTALKRLVNDLRAESRPG
jgi:uncharacterized protein YjbI with pentapeptide repeats